MRCSNISGFNTGCEVLTVVSNVLSGTISFSCALEDQIYDSLSSMSADKALSVIVKSALIITEHAQDFYPEISGFSKDIKAVSRKADDYVSVRLRKAACLLDSLSACIRGKNESVSNLCECLCVQASAHALIRDLDENDVQPTLYGQVIVFPVSHSKR